jgi:putative glutamine amidotransferase
MCAVAHVTGYPNSSALAKASAEKSRCARVMGVRLPHLAARCYDYFLMAGDANPKPRIGVPYRTKKEQHNGDHGKIQRYLKAVRMGGGEPVEIPLDLSPSEFRALAESLDGIALSGSPADVEPSLFNAARHANTSASDRDRERTDFALLEHCFEESKPVLAICYGIQSLNVFLGGNLVQDIPTEVDSKIEHDVQSDYGIPETFHMVRIEHGSRVADLALGSSEVRVNSSHHQAVLTSGRGLRITARAADGVIEAMEGTSAGHWLTAVQWHPERLVEVDAFALSLFRSLVTAARKAPART